MTAPTVAIGIQHLVKQYRGSEKPAVDGISLEIPGGRIFGLLGPNGAGKTTTIRILCGLLSPTSGSVTIGGYSLERELPRIKQIIGVVPQEIALYPTLTARENLRVYGGILGLGGRQLRTRMEELLGIFGLDRVPGMQVGKYSGGMKRRLNLIVGLLHKPTILFLDEPTVGVDVHSKNVIIDYLLELNRQGTTIIYTSHYLEEAENLCSYLAILDEGKIVTRGTLNEIRESHRTDSKLEDIFLELTGKALRD